MNGMPSTIRLNAEEQEEIRKKCIEINKLLIRAGKEPMKDSELVHKILDKTIRYATVGTDGEIVIDLP